MGSSWIRSKTARYLRQQFSSMGVWIGYDDLVGQERQRLGFYYSYGDPVSPAGVRIRLPEKRLTERQAAVREAFATVPDVDALFASDDGSRVVVFVREFNPVTEELLAEVEDRLSPSWSSSMIDVHVYAHQGRPIPSELDGLTLLFPLH